MKVKKSSSLKRPSLGRQQFGFSLIELMVVVAIVGILAVVAAPDLTQYRANKRMQSLVTDFTTSIRLTRSEALKRNRVVTMCRTTTPELPNATCTPGTDWNVGWMVFEDSDGDYQRTPDNEPILSIQSAKTDYGRVDVGDADYVISFTPLSTSANGVSIANTVWFAPNSPPGAAFARKIVINRTGRFKVEVI